MSPASLMLPVLLACFGSLVSAQVLPPGSCPLLGTLEYTVLLPHPKDCSKFFCCKQGHPIEMNIPTGQSLDKNLLDCVFPRDEECASQCFPLQNDVGGSWSPSSCTAGPNKQGASCKLQCNDGYQLRGSSSIQCKDKFWNSVNGDFIPRCRLLECIAEDIDDEFNQTLSRDAGILFVLDESGSVGEENFQRSKAFVKSVVKKYPLSASRSAGVITFSRPARVPIHLNVDSTSDFLSAVDKIQYSKGGTDVLAALEAAVKEIEGYSQHPLTLVVLITDGQSETDATPAANKIKNAGNPLFTIGIDAKSSLVYLESLSSTGKNGIKHFFHVTNYNALENIGKYFEAPPGSGGSSGSISKCKN